MRPPECALCDAAALEPVPDDRSGRVQVGALVTFAEDDATRRFHERASAEGFVGHPPNQVWLCGAHVDAGRALAHLPWTEARARLHAPPTPPAPQPAEDTDLRARLQRRRETSRSFPIPTMHAAAIAQRLASDIDAVLAALDLPLTGPIALDARRTWHPMDRVEPPWCPYALDWSGEASAGGWTVWVRADAAHYSDEEVGRASASLHLLGPAATGAPRVDASWSAHASGTALLSEGATFLEHVPDDDLWHRRLQDAVLGVLTRA